MTSDTAGMNTVLEDFRPIEASSETPNRGSGGPLGRFSVKCVQSNNVPTGDFYAHHHGYSILTFLQVYFVPSSPPDGT